MDDVELFLLVAFFVAIIQTLVEAVPSFAVEDQAASKMGALLGFDPLNVSDVQLLLSIAALNDYKF
jgi:hypothetical protein